MSDRLGSPPLRRAAPRVGQPGYTSHDFRHRYAKLLVLAGVPLQLVKEILGHSKPSTSTDTYGHVLLDEPEWRLRELREAVGPDGPGQRPGARARGGGRMAALRASKWVS